jgi:hypothetical protein
MTDRDTFAAAALTGLLVHANDSIDEETLDTPSDIAYTAYQMADAMLRERDRTTHTPVTEPMPKEKLTEGSAMTAQSVVGATDAAGKADYKSGNGVAVALRVSAESGLMPCVRDTGNDPSLLGRKPGGNPAATDCVGDATCGPSC